MDRRSFMRATAAASALATGLGPSFWRTALAAPATDGPGPYGPLGSSPDENGVLLPEGFSSRVITAAFEPIGASGYVWHTDADGAATFPAPDGGWYYAQNSEATFGRVSAIRFDPDGEVVDAYRILEGTSINCAGGPTPWGHWLSCEERDNGRVWECDPSQPGQGVQHVAMGTFTHEAVAIDPRRGVAYMTEDVASGFYYRYTPTNYPDLSAGVLEVARMPQRPSADGTPEAIEWLEVPDPSIPSHRQGLDGTTFTNGEGIWHDPAGGGWIYFTTKGDNFVWAHDLRRDEIFALYAGDGQLTGVDNLMVAPSGDLYVAEDGGNLEICIVSADERTVSPFLRLPGPEHLRSELTGPCFSPDGTRLYFSSQRGTTLDGRGLGLGVTFEVTGPFRTKRVGVAALGSSGAPGPLPRPRGSGVPGPADAPAPVTPADNRSALPVTGGGVGTASLAAMALATALRRRQRPTE